MWTRGPGVVVAEQTFKINNPLKNSFGCFDISGQKGALKLSVHYALI